MKIKILSIGLILISSWLILFATSRYVGRIITSKETACKSIEYQIELGKCAETNDIDGLYIEKRTKGLRKSRMLLGIGLLSMFIGLILYIKKYPILGSWKKKILELIINLFYWISFSYLIGYMVSGGGIMFTSCSVDWIFLFLISGMVGFYSSYTLIYVKQQNNRNWKQLIGYGVLFSAIGSALSYLPVAIMSAIATGVYFNIQLVLALGFFSFVSFIHIFIGFYGKKVIERINI